MENRSDSRVKSAQLAIVTTIAPNSRELSKAAKVKPSGP